MTCLSVSKEQYKSIVEKPFCGLDSAEFAELNKHKVDEVKYFIFSDKAKVYDIIRANRQERGFPLWLSQKDIDEMAKLIKLDYFLVFDSGEAIASAYIQYITQNAVNIVYWENLAHSNELCPMNFLTEQVYQQSNTVKYISIGTSTLNGVANVGLCYFKESVGCVASPKLSFVLNMTQDSTLFVATATCWGLILMYFSFSLSKATFSFSFLIIDFIQSKAFYDTH